MRKPVFLILITILFSGVIAATASAQNLVCWELQLGLSTVQSIQIKVSVLDMGNGNYALVGSTHTTTTTEPPKVVRRVFTGGAVVMGPNNIEVSLNVTDIYDRPSTADVVEGLIVSDYHMLLDGTLNGTFQRITTNYPVASDTESAVDVTSREGTVTLVDCN